MRSGSSITGEVMKRSEGELEIVVVPLMELNYIYTPPVQILEHTRPGCHLLTALSFLYPVEALENGTRLATVRSCPIVTLLRTLASTGRRIR